MSNSNGFSYNYNTAAAYNNKNDALSCNSSQNYNNVFPNNYDFQKYGRDITYDDFGNSFSACPETFDGNAAIDAALYYTNKKNENESGYGTCDLTTAKNLGYDGSAGNGGRFEDIYDCYDNETLFSGSHNLLSSGGGENNVKVLPQLPIRQSSSVCDGMYDFSNDSGDGSHRNFKRFGVVGRSSSRMLPHLTTTSIGISIANADANVVNSCGSLQACSSGVRILPQPQHAQSQNYHLRSNTHLLTNRRNIHNSLNSTAITATTTTNYQYDQMTINQDQEAYQLSWTCSSAPALTTYNHNINFDNDKRPTYLPYPQSQQRPHTSLAPLSYYDDSGADEDADFYLDDNLSTYSDTPVALASTTASSNMLPTLVAQQKLQKQQQRKLSLMMAMTTASVIASGETRITAAQKEKKQQLSKVQSSSSPTKTNKVNSYKNNYSAGWLYDKVGNAITTTTASMSTITGASIVTTTSELYYNTESKYLRPANNTTTLSSKHDLLASTMATTTSVATTLSKGADTTMMPLVSKPTRSRKLPKCLPTLPEKTKQSKEFSVVSDSSSSLTHKPTAKGKSLPKLPTSEKKINNNSTTESERFSIVSESIPPASVTSATTQITSLASAEPSTTLKSIEAIDSISHISHEKTDLTSSSLYSDKYASIIDTTISITSSPSHAPRLLKSSYDISNDNDNSNLNNNNNSLHDNHLNDDFSTSFNSYQAVDTFSSSPPSVLAMTSYAPVTSYATLSIFTSSLPYSPYYVTSSLKQSSPTTSKVETPLEVADYLKSYSFPSADVLDSKEPTTINDPSSLIWKTTNSIMSSETSEISCISKVHTTSSSTSAYSIAISTTHSPNLEISFTTTSVPPSLPTATSTSTTPFNIAKGYLDYLDNDIKMKDYLTSSDQIDMPNLTILTPSFVTTTTTDSIKRAITTETSSENDKSKLNNQIVNHMNSNHTDILSPLAKTSSILALDETTTAALPSNVTTTGKVIEPFSTDYEDYLKKFELPELPPLLLSSATTMPTDNSVNTIMPSNESLQCDEGQGKLPAYLTEFLNGDFNKKYGIVEDQINFAKTEFIPEQIPPSPTMPTMSIGVIETSEAHLKSTIASSNGDAGTSAFSSNIYDSNSFFNPDANFSKYADDGDELNTCRNVSNVLNTPTTTFSVQSEADSKFQEEVDEFSSPFSAAIASTNLSCNFDDNFYDSFKVDLDTLTASISTASETSKHDTISIAAPIQEITLKTSTQLSDFTTASLMSAQVSSSNNIFVSAPSGNTQGGYYCPPSKSKAESTQKSSSSIAATKATSMLEGLSKGIKGSLLDGVLTVSADKESTQQQQTTSSKKSSFGFGLASKLVPNVGVLLSGSAATSTASDNKPSTTRTNTTAVDSATTTAKASTTITNTHFAYDANVYATDSQIPATTSDLPKNFSNHQQVETIDCDPQQMYGYDIATTTTTTETNCEADYIPYQQDYDHMTAGTAGYGDEYVAGIDSDYTDYNMTNIYAVEKSDGNMTVMQSQQQKENVSTAMTYEPVSVPITSAKHEVPKKPIGSSLLSTLANVGGIQQQQSIATSTASTTTHSKPLGSSMFGSILGKAAAAVQSATQAVNQGAAAIVQQQPQKTAASTTTVTAPLSLNNAYSSQQMQMQQQQQDSLLGYHTTYSSQMKSTAADTDYENSNMVDVFNQLTINNSNDISTINYYSNGNQNQPPIVTTAKLLPTVPAAAAGKKLPNIANGISNKNAVGYLVKQQPTEVYDDDLVDDIDINHLNGDIDVDDDTALKSKNLQQFHSNDNQQHDYYLCDDHTVVSSAAPITTTAISADHVNGYYDKSPFYKDDVGGYDYREDFFDEEDEYKYLQKEAEAEHMAQQEALYQQQQQRRKQDKLLLLQHQKRSSSLEFADDLQGDLVDYNNHSDNYINDDNYPSEDSGNYLDESSSGSVGGMVIKSTEKASTMPTSSKISTPATTASSIGVAHLPVKKQDSILLEEEILSPELIGDVNLESPIASSAIARSAKSTAFRRKSSDIVISDEQSLLNDYNDHEDDQLSELPSTMQQRKKKMLMRGETEEVVSGHMQMLKRQKPPEVTAKQRWHWAYNKIIMQLNVSTYLF